MPTQEDYIKFKSVLEYFVSHLRYIQSGDISSQGYITYIKPWVDNKEFVPTGPQDKNLQKQIEKWNNLSIGTIAITIQNNFGKGYWTRKCFINWIYTGINVYANWDSDGHIVGLCLAYYEKNLPLKYVDGFSLSLEDLGLFSTQQTDMFIKFTNKYFEMYQTLNQNIKMATNCRLLSNNHNLILTGAPGTGKTYLAKEIAKAMGCTDDEIGFVQFHPSYDYTDFVEGLRPIQDDNTGSVGFERKDGVFKEFCKKALKNLNNSKNPNESQNNSDFETAFEKLLDDVSCGDIREYETQGGNFSVYLNLKGLLEYEQKNTKRTKTTKKNYLKILFDKFKNFKSDKILNLSRDEMEKVISDSNCGIKTIDYIQYRWALSKIVKNFESKTGNCKVSSVEKKNFVFIIDEINRGEISKIFGELFFSIDPGYRGEKGKTNTQYQNLVEDDDDFKKGFFVPENVYIIGTMNDIDRSVESMDFAFRRRFAFKEITAEDSQKMFDNDKVWDNKKPDVDKLKKRMNNLNNKISSISGLNSAYHIGGAYFLKLKYYEGEGKDRYNELWNNHLNGVLREYLRGNPKIEEYMKELRNAYDDESDDTQNSN